ncbi:MAG: hypothetical protein K1X88_12615 [Nannocystaceae bacterium]|nr:hypothetical protein [Nannocystaceae bacterium]
MLYLGNGVTQIKIDDNRALYVLPDFSDPTQFYYLPNSPHLAKMPDGSPGIRLLVFREDLDTVAAGDDDAVAFLSVDVDLSWEPEAIARAASRLQSDNNLEQRPRLTPIFFRGGSVKLMLLDAVTPDPAAPPGTPPPTSEFVAKIMGTSSPSLYGDNRAIFQAKLSKKGAAALQAALDGVTPIGVVYSLTFAGLQPAFHVKANVDWQKVYDHFSERTHVNALFVDVDIQKSIDTLVEQKAITFDVTVEGIGDEGMDAEREKAMTAIRQLIFEKFFEATFKRESAAGDDTGDNIIDGIAAIARIGMTLGVGVSYARKEVKIEELRSIDIDWTARKATERTIFPQAHMHNLLTSAGVTRDQLVTIVDGADDLWRNLPFQVTAAAAWEQDGIVGIAVSVEYDEGPGGPTHDWNVLLTKDAPQATKREWMDRRGGNGFRYKYTVSFQDDAVPGPRSSVNSGEAWTDHDGTVLLIHPRDLYDTLALEVAVIPGFPFDRYPAVQAVLRYRTDDGSFEHFEDGVLSATKTSLSTRFRVDKGVPGAKELRLIYIGTDGRRTETPWMPMVQDQWVVEDPQGNKFPVRAVVAGDRKNIANLIVDLEYVDLENGVQENGMLQFDPQNIAVPQTWTFHLVDPTRRRYRYRMTLVTTAGEFVQTGWITTDAPTLPVGEVYVRRLTVQLATGELVAGCEGVDVTLAYDDDEHAVHQTQTFRLGRNANAEWTVQLQDASRRSYQVTTTWIMADGFNPKVGPTSRSETFLAIPAAPPENR